MSRLPLTSLLLMLLTSGCGQIGPFGQPATFPDVSHQLCVETALRRAPDPSAVDLAFERFAVACDRGDMGACSALGVMYERGLGVDRDERMAFALFQQSCRGGNDGGCVNLGLAYVDGVGVEFNSRNAAELFAVGCAKGDPRGCLELAELHVAGDGVPKDTTRGAQLYAQACQAGRPEACYAVARLHEDGIIGPDPVAAMTFFEQACVAGYEDSCDRLDRSYARRRPAAPPAGTVPTCTPGQTDGCHAVADLDR